MTNVRFTLKSVTVLTFVFAVALGANAQAARTWVSVIGDDISLCSRIVPCKTWAGAISKTAAGGEIHALAPDGLGIWTITETINLESAYTFASNLTSRANGVSIDDTTYVDSSGTSCVMRTTPLRRVKILSSRPAEELAGTGYLSRSCGGNC
jgi:hypothetical protein